MVGTLAEELRKKRGDLFVKEALLEQELAERKTALAQAESVLAKERAKMESALVKGRATKVSTLAEVRAKKKSTLAKERTNM